MGRSSYVPTIIVELLRCLLSLTECNVERDIAVVRVHVKAMVLALPCLVLYEKRMLLVERCSDSDQVLRGELSGDLPLCFFCCPCYW